MNKKKVLREVTSLRKTIATLVSRVDTLETTVSQNQNRADEMHDMTEDNRSRLNHLQGEASPTARLERITAAWVKGEFFFDAETMKIYTAWDAFFGNVDVFDCELLTAKVIRHKIQRDVNSVTKKNDEANHWLDEHTPVDVDALEFKAQHAV